MQEPLFPCSSSPLELDATGSPNDLLGGIVPQEGRESLNSLDDLENSEYNLSAIDIAGFARELDELRTRIYDSISKDDYSHLRRVEWRGRACTIFGYATAWIIPNPISAFCLSLGQFTRWLLAHHILHRGYDKVPDIPVRYTSKKFARGWRRFIDWFDWFEPEAWDYQHNVLHHYHTAETDDDPDIIEDAVEYLRKMRVPLTVKYLILTITALTWKFTFYAPTTCCVLHPPGKKRVRLDDIAWLTIKNVFDFRNRNVRRLWLRSYLPYGLFHFVLVPALFLPLGQTAALFVFINKLLAEAITNIHSFIVIAPNHTADDLHKFGFHYKSKEEFYLTQILSSANYATGTEFRDYMSIWLNYQIEHHLFPDLPMLRYREVQPLTKALCQKYGIPYRQESIFKRFGRMVKVCVGERSLRELESFPIAQAAR